MTEKYIKWVEWEKDNNPIGQLTGTQAELAEKILNDQELCDMLTYPGDKISVIERIQRYLKS